MPLVALLILLAQEGLPPVPPRMLVDEDPSAMACTFELALRGGSCAYEATSRSVDPRDNSGTAAEAGQRACAGESRRDEGLRRDCEKAVAEVALSPKCAIGVRLADEQGRLTPQAQACAEQLRQAISRTSRGAALSLTCCSCLAESRCSVSASQCKRELADLIPGAALKSCMAKSCQDACAFTTPAKASPAPGPEMLPPVPEDNPTRPTRI